jgi:hypothetical protein
VDEGKALVLHLDQTESVLGHRLLGGHDGGHLLSLVPDLGAEDGKGPAVAGGQVGEIALAYHVHDARQRPGAADVDAADLPAGDGGGKDLPVQEAVGMEVGRISTRVWSWPTTERADRSAGQGGACVSGTSMRISSTRSSISTLVRT